MKYLLAVSEEATCPWLRFKDYLSYLGVYTMFLFKNLLFIILLIILWSVTVISAKRFRFAWRWAIPIACLITLSITFSFYRLSVLPNIFLDEANGAYDSWSLALYHVDSNLNTNPIYLQSFAGQGQSILYTWLAIPFMKIFGLQIVAFRLPMVLASALTLILFFFTLMYIRLKPQLLFGIMIAASTSPWLLMMNRWGLDCNITAFTSLSALCFILLAIHHPSHKTTNLFYLLGFFFISLTAYGYNAAWVFLPLFVIGLLAYLYKQKQINLQKLFVLLAFILILTIPIVNFAISSNINSLNHTHKFLWWTIPELIKSRATVSIIDLNLHRLLPNILKNLAQGSKMFYQNSDGLPWNSRPNFGAYYVFALPLFLIGLGTIRKSHQPLARITIIWFLAMIPSLLIITPNYNHWILLHFPVLITIGFGINTILQSVNRKTVLTAITFTYLINLGLFAREYFVVSQRTPFPTSQDIPNSQVAIDKIKQKKAQRIYFDGLDHYYTTIRFFAPLSPYEWQKQKDHPFSKRILTTTNRYGQFYAIPTKVDAKKSILVVRDDHQAMYKTLSGSYAHAEPIIFAGADFTVYYNK